MAFLEADDPAILPPSAISKVSVVNAMAIFIGDKHFGPAATPHIYNHMDGAYSIFLEGGFAEAS